MSDKAKIEEREDGPLMVRGLTSLTDADGNAVDCKPVMALCRCGKSGNKPFCDGSHKDAGFKSRGGKPEGPDRFFTYEGQEITVSFNPRLCSHAAQCGKLAKHIFDPSQKPWVQPDNGTVAEVEAVIAACPSGALQMGTPPETRTDTETRIKIQKDGPYWVSQLEIETDATAVGLSEEKFVLCRCGQSGNKPYCDGSHRDAGWKSDD